MTPGQVKRSGNAPSAIHGATTQKEAHQAIMGAKHKGKRRRRVTDGVPTFDDFERQERNRGRE